MGQFTLDEVDEQMVSDQKLVDNIKTAYGQLTQAINAALVAGLKVDCRIDSSNRYTTSDVEKVRTSAVTATRSYI